MHSFERRADFAEIARGQRRTVPGRPAAGPGELERVGDLADDGPRLDARAGLTSHRVVLDMLAPWECIEAVAAALMPGGILVAYIATTTQLSRMAETLRVDGRFTEPAGAGAAGAGLAPGGAGRPAATIG